MAWSDQFQQKTQLERKVMAGAPGLDFFGVKALKNELHGAISKIERIERQLARLRELADQQAVK